MQHNVRQKSVYQARVMLQCVSYISACDDVKLIFQLKGTHLAIVIPLSSSIYTQQ